MKTKTSAIKSSKGMTLLELTVVILVLLSLISILFVGAQAWKAGADRAGCLITIRNVQQGVRSYANMHNLAPEKADAWPAKVIGAGLYVESTASGVLNDCPAGGAYSLESADAIPPIGKIAAVCAIADHVIPVAETAGW